MNYAQILAQAPRLKAGVHRLLVPRRQARPRAWVRWFVNPFFHKRGRGANICRRTRMDVLPWNPFELGAGSTIEDFSTVNNGVGPVRIGPRTRVGLGCTLIGPVQLGQDVRLAQNVVLSGLNHNYEDIGRPIAEQGVTTHPISVGDGSWIGANATVVAGVRIGRNCVVAGGSVVTKDVPDYCVVAGNPARIVKQYNPETSQWERLPKTPVYANP